MVTIRKGNKETSVTVGAYNAFYKRNGWKISGHEDSVSRDEWDDMEEEPTKPLSEMNRAELEQLAEDMGVSLAGLTNNKQIREAIKNAM